MAVPPTPPLAMLQNLARAARALRKHRVIIGEAMAFARNVATAVAGNDPAQQEVRDWAAAVDAALADLDNPT
jgi:hypothetical protein